MTALACLQQNKCLLRLGFICCSGRGLTVKLIYIKLPALCSPKDFP